MTIKAADKRLAAIKVFCDKYRPESNGYRLIESATAEDMISEIEAMRSLGRTDRWQSNLTGWIQLIRDYPHDMDWAMLQGSIYAAYAAD